MKLALITVQKEKPGPVVAEMIARLGEHGASVDLIYPEDRARDVAEVRPEYDLYILKSSTRLAMVYAGLLHQAGARIINPVPAVTLMKDKYSATAALLPAGVPLPRTWMAESPAQLSEALETGPIVVKPYFGSQGRGVHIVRTQAELDAIPDDFGITFAQSYYESDGRDHKIYRIGDELFGVRRVWPAKTYEDKLGEPFEVTGEMRDVTLRCGDAFGVDLYGLDVIMNDDKPWVVDINTFPGFKGVPDAGRRLGDYVIGIANQA